MRAYLLLAIALAACGDDEAGGGNPGPRPATPATPGAGPGAGSGSNALQPRAHVEDGVRCPVPERPTGRACDLKAPDCEDPQHPEVHLYCLAFSPTSGFCEPCPERESIRHPFKDRDFGIDSRDPFQSFVLLQPGMLGGTDTGPPKDVAKKCIRDDQMVATSYSYSDLKLVGILAQGTQRKVLMLDSTGRGHIVKRGDCVGKEKAVVKDIGTGFITFEVDPDAAAGGARPEEHSVQLHPTMLDVSAPPSDTVLPRTTIQPAAPVPAVVPAPVPGPARSPATK